MIARCPISKAQYARGFKAYMGFAAARNTIGSHWFNQQLQYLPRAPSGKYRFLDVGAGTGSFTFRACQMILATGHDVECTALEPNPDLFPLMKQTLDEAGFPFVSFQHHPLTWEAYRAANAGEQFDVVNGRNVLYYFPNWQDVMQEWAESLAPGGQGFINHNTAVGFNQIIRWASGWQPGDPPGACLFIEDVVDGLVDMGIRHQYEALPADIEVTPCLDPASQDGLDYLAFVMDEELKHSDTPRAVEGRTFLRHLARPQRGTKRWFLRHDLGTIRFWAA